MTDSTALAQHITELATRFNVKLDVRRGMDPGGAAAGYVVMTCPNCSRPNALRHAGTVRCGACKHPLGRHDRNMLVVIAPVTCEATYAVALHELGHCLHPTGRVNESEGSRTMRRTGNVATLRDMRLQLLEETSAWEWAEANALDWTPTMQQVKALALGSYEKHARQLGLKVRTV